MDDKLWRFMVVLAYVSLVAQVPIWLISRTIWNDLAGADIDRARPRAWHPALVGVIERGLYLAALSAGQPAFIAAWFAVKSAGHWKGWSDGLKLGPPGEHPTTVITGRELANTFLIGNGLSIGFALAGWYALEAPMQDFIRSPAAMRMLGPFVVAFGIWGAVWILIRWDRPAVARRSAELAAQRAKFE